MNFDRNRPWRFVVGICLSLAVAGLGVPSLAAEPVEPEKRSAAGARLLLPYFEVDTNAPFGATTFFSVRNQLDTSTPIQINYYRVDQPQAPQRSELATLGRKEIRPFNIRDVPNLQVDPDGIARGFVIVEGLGGAEGIAGASILQGDYFQLTPDEDFATGSRLLNIDPNSPDNDLCNLMTIRFLNGGAFDSGTDLVFWLSADFPPDPEEGPVFAYAVYGEAGGDPLLVATYLTDQVAFKIPAADLLRPIVTENFGAIEIQFDGTSVGHMAAVMSAQNRFSVGFEAICGD